MAYQDGPLRGDLRRDCRFATGSPGRPERSSVQIVRERYIVVGDGDKGRLHEAPHGIKVSAPGKKGCERSVAAITAIRSTGQLSWSTQLVHSAGPLNWSTQLVHSTGQLAPLNRPYQRDDASHEGQQMNEATQRQGSGQPDAPEKQKC